MTLPGRSETEKAKVAQDLPRPRSPAGRGLRASGANPRYGISR